MRIAYLAQERWVGYKHPTSAHLEMTDKTLHWFVENYALQTDKDTAAEVLGATDWTIMDFHIKMNPYLPLPLEWRLVGTGPVEFGLIERGEFLVCHCGAAVWESPRDMTAGLCPSCEFIYHCQGNRRICGREDVCI